MKISESAVADRKRIHCLLPTSGLYAWIALFMFLFTLSRAGVHVVASNSIFCYARFTVLSVNAHLLKTVIDADLN